MSLLAEPLTGYAAEIGLGIVALAFGIRKLYLLWGRDTQAMGETAARTDVMQMLRDELTRISAQREAMGKELGGLQANILNLTHQSALLSQQVVLLTQENISLKKEIGDLRLVIGRLEDSAPDLLRPAL